MKKADTAECEEKRKRARDTTYASKRLLLPVLGERREHLGLERRQVASDVAVDWHVRLPPELHAGARAGGAHDARDEESHRGKGVVVLEEQWEQKAPAAF